MPRVIYCIHALSSHLFKMGKAPLIHDVFGKAVFTGKFSNFVFRFNLYYSKYLSIHNNYYNFSLQMNNSTLFRKTLKNVSTHCRRSKR